MNWISEGLKVGDVVWVCGDDRLQPLRVVRITKSSVFVRRRRQLAEQCGEDRYRLSDGYPPGESLCRIHRGLRRDCDEIRIEYRKQVERRMARNLVDRLQVRCDSLQTLLLALDSTREELAAKIALFSDMDSVDGDRIGKLIRRNLDAQDEEWKRVKEDVAKEGKK